MRKNDSLQAHRNDAGDDSSIGARLRASDRVMEDGAWLRLRRRGESVVDVRQRHEGALEALFDGLF